MGMERSKAVTVGGREFVVRPLLVKVAKEIGQRKEGDDSFDWLVKMVTKALQRTAPDVTEAWVVENADVAELNDVAQALNDISAMVPKKGEAQSP